MLNCTKCLRLLSEEMFCKRSNVPRGYMSSCKDCEKKRGAENRIKFKRNIQKYHKELNQDPLYKANRRVYMRDRYRKNGMTDEAKEKKRIRQKKYYNNKKWVRDRFICIGKTKTAIKNGVLIPKPCEYPNCKHTHLRVESHHWDYAQPMWVTWFCSQHHGLADRIRKAKDKYTHNS